MGKVEKFYPIKSDLIHYLFEGFNLYKDVKHNKLITIDKIGIITYMLIKRIIYHYVDMKFLNCNKILGFNWRWSILLTS